MPNLLLQDVSFTYPNGFLAVDNINIKIHEGENIAIVGQNGAGKTTVVKMMNGLLKPTRGNVLIGDMNTKDYTTAQISRHVGYVFQNPDDQIFHSTVESEVRFGPKMMKLNIQEEDRLVQEALELTGMNIYKDENPFNLPLSLRKFVTIAAVIAMNTQVLIFDEPTAGQDIAGNKRLTDILTTLHRNGKTMITISHDMEFVAANFEKVIVMANKKILHSGTPEEIFWNFEVLEKAMLKQPYVSRVCKELKIKGNIIGIDMAVNAIMEEKEYAEKL